MLGNWLWDVEAAWDALRANQLRSLLATLGITIGIASVIVMAAIGHGLKDQVVGGVDSLGSNLVMIWPGAGTGTGTGDPRGRAARLTEGDVQAIRRSGVARAVSGQLRGAAAATAPRFAEVVSVVGIDAAYEDAAPSTLYEGRLLTRTDFDLARRNAVVDRSLADRLFESGSALGRSITLRERPYTIVGIVEAASSDGSGTVMIPLQTMRRRLVGTSSVAGQVSSIFVRLEPNADTAASIAIIENALAASRPVTLPGASSFQIIDSAEFARQSQRIVGALQAGLVAIAAISLVVGGVGVMNIMLVSVTERTREIGIRLAVGATPDDIRRQFLVEAALLCLLGGVIGVTIGVALSLLVSGLSGWNTRPTPDVVAGALLVATVVGMMAGYLPARKAAKLSPVVAIGQV